MNAIRQGHGRLRTLLFATLALALLNQSVFGLGCLSCSDESALHAAATADLAQADWPASPGENCGTCCDALPPGQCGGQAASISASSIHWQAEAQFCYAQCAVPTPDPPSVLTERFRPPIR